MLHYRGSEKRVLSHKGIEFAGLVYNSPELGDLRRLLGDRINVDVRVNRSESEGKQLIAQESVESLIKKPVAKSMKPSVKGATIETAPSTANTALDIFPVVVRKHFTPIFENRMSNDLRTAGGEAIE